MREGDTWIDGAMSDSARVVGIKPFSEAWFKLVDAIPELRNVFALGDKIVIATRTLTLEVSDAGSETISENDLRVIQSGW